MAVGRARPPTCSDTAGAGLASRAQVTAPGSSIAAVVALAVLGPHLMSRFPAGIPLPAGLFPGSVVTFWVAALALGLAGCAQVLAAPAFTLPVSPVDREAVA